MSDNMPELPQPRSLGSHVVAEDRATLIRQHIAMLSETALEVGDALPFVADVSDLRRILDAEPEEA
jgi:hypothetical protein